MEATHKRENVMSNVEEIRKTLADAFPSEWVIVEGDIVRSKLSRDLTISVSARPPLFEVNVEYLKEESGIMTLDLNHVPDNVREALDQAIIGSLSIWDKSSYTKVARSLSKLDAWVVDLARISLEKHASECIEQAKSYKRQMDLAKRRHKSVMKILMRKPS